MSVRGFQWKSQISFSGFYISHFAFFGVVLPFLPLWMGEQGLSAGEAGQILSAAFLSKVFFANLFGALSDSTGHRKYWIIFLAAINIGGFWIFAQTETFFAMFITWLIVGPLQTSLVPMIDGLAISAVRRNMLSYGPARLCGSVAFIVISTAVGYYIAQTSIDRLPMLMMICAVIVLMASFSLPDLRPRQKAGRKFAILDVVKLQGFLPFILTAALLQACHGALYAIGSQHWANAGIHQDVIGFLWAEGVVAEVILFAFGAALVRKLGLRGLLWFAATGGFIRWVILGHTTSVEILALIQVGHALTFAATHLAVTNFIRLYVPENLTSSAQTFYDSLANGILMGSFMSISSWLYDYALGGKVYWIMAAISAIAAVSLLLTRSQIAIEQVHE